MKILCIGLNHETAPVAVREKLALDNSARSQVLRWLLERTGIQEAIILSTCNRVEFYLVVEESSFAGQSVMEELFQVHLGLQENGWEDFLYQHTYHRAITHLFNVTSGMDSMVIGEPQITGQVKEAYRQGVQQKSVGIILNRLLHKSFSVSKRVRTETELASRAVSVSYVAVELARKIFGDLNERTAMLACPDHPRYSDAGLTGNNARVAVLVQSHPDRFVGGVYIDPRSVMEAQTLVFLGHNTPIGP